MKYLVDVDSTIPPQASTFLDNLAHQYRKQLGRCMSVACVKCDKSTLTRDDLLVYCRFCGERLFQQVKQPHQLMRESPDAQRHLTICALQMLAGIRNATPVGHRALPMEAWW